MSTSGLIAAKKRIESSVKKYAIPAEPTATPTDVCKNGSLLLSLLQSRLNWSTSVFPKYKTDPVLQPKRTNNSRKKWPNMEYLGTCCLELGAHVFEQTSFYQAIRSESWASIAKSQGLDVPEDSDTGKQLQFVDIVFELKEVTNERFLFPKTAILDSILADNEQYMVLASFALPIDPTTGDEFFNTPKEKILKYGESSELPCIKDFIQSNTTSETSNSEILPNTTYEPANIRMTKVNSAMVEALNNYVQAADQVRQNMKEKMKSFSKRPFIKFDLTDDPIRSTEINDLVKKATTIPDIATGPIQAEKKRNEILNAIRLGKRPRDEKFEAELPKNKYANAKEDTSFKCAYCSTKQTAMWRPGPGGHGTLCNSCGIQWKRGEILKGAPVISVQEERRLFIERKEREKAAEALELEKIERENKKHQRKMEKHNISGQESSLNSSSHFAAQLLQQRSRQQTNTTNHIPNTASLSENSVVSLAKGKATTSCNGSNSSTATATTIMTATTSSSKPQTSPIQPQNIAPKGTVAPSPQQEQTKVVPLSLYSAAGIPLPTLSINFASSLQFAHPNCGVTLLDGHFSVRLCKDGAEQTTIAIDKKDLMDAEFEVVSESDAPLLREVLHMKVMPEQRSIEAFGQTIQIDKQNPIHIRFLEKLDPSGGAVVKRILQRWLITIPQTS